MVDMRRPRVGELTVFDCCSQITVRPRFARKRRGRSFYGNPRFSSNRLMSVTTLPAQVRHRVASRERVRARARSNCSWKGYRHGTAFDLEPKLENGCAHRSRASAHSSEQMQPSGASARVQINGATRVAQFLHMPVSISVLIKSVDPKEDPSPREALRTRQRNISVISSVVTSRTASRIACRQIEGGTVSG